MKTCVACVLFVSAFGGGIGLAIDAGNNSKGTNQFADPTFFFSSPNAAYLWSLILVNGVASHTIKSRAEKRLEKNLFTTDSLCVKG